MCASAGSLPKAAWCMRSASSATSKTPMPPTCVAVPRKYFSTKVFSRPMASKSCAPQYDMYVLTPILDMIFDRPLPMALT